jgi:hypothetical protein
MKRGVLGLFAAVALIASVATGQNPVPFPTNLSDNGDSVVQATQKLLNVSTRANALTITGNDTTDLAHAVNAIYVGGAGSVKVDMAGSGTAITFTGVPVGTTLYISAKRVYLTGTTATNLIGLY